jgi:competence ComEA-like helix-hairpin-helix protein
MKKGRLRKWVGLLTVPFLILALSMAVLAQDGKKKTGKTVNINKATAEEIAKNCPLIPLGLAKKIIQYRQDVGIFQSLEELLQVEDFDRKLLNKVKPFLLLEGLGGGDCTC